MADTASWFFPPRKRRNESRGGFEGASVTVGGREYRGGYVHGPLSAGEIADLILAGHGDRIVEGDPSRPPRRHPADVEL